jgi:hypothetical protein
MSAPRNRKADRQHIRGPLTGCVQPGPGNVQDGRHTLTVMNNMHNTPAGDGTVPADTTNPSARSRKKWLFGWGIGITLAGFLAGGGIALAMSGGAAPVASTTPAAGAAQGASTAPAASQAQGAILNSELNTAGSTAVPWPHIRWALARLRALGGVHGEFTYHNKTGFHTLAFERGAIQSVNGNDVVVIAPDGTTWTWLIVSDTVVRKDGSKTTTSALSPGELVFAGGPVINGARDARLIVIRPAGSGSTPSTPSTPSAPSGSSSSSSSAGTSVS